MENKTEISVKTGKRILGVDYGSKRVGVAVSNEEKTIAMPVSVIQNTVDLIAEMEKLAVDYETKEIVLGESRNYQGKPNDIFLESLEFKNNMEAKGYIVHFEPEFMTSIEAERIQGKIEKLDASAAAIILQSYLDRTNQQHD